MQKLKEDKKILSFFIINHTEGAVRRCSKKMDLENMGKFKGKHPCWGLFCNKGAGLKFTTLKVH